MAINKLILNVESVDEETGEVTTQELDITTLIVGALGKKTTTVKKKSSSSKIEEKRYEYWPNTRNVVKIPQNICILPFLALSLQRIKYFYNLFKTE